MIRPSLLLVPALLLPISLTARPALGFEPEDGGYGRLEGDLGLSVETGVSETFVGESIMTRAGVSYLSSIALVGQYNDTFELGVQSLHRSLLVAVEVRPLFLGRWAKDMQRGPAYLDLFVDSLALGLGLYRSWLRPGHCPPNSAVCRDDGMELSLGLDMSLLPQADTPFIALRGALRWSLQDRSASLDAPPIQGMVSLSLGYRHLFAVGAVDAGDPLPAR